MKPLDAYDGRREGEDYRMLLKAIYLATQVVAYHHATTLMSKLDPNSDEYKDFKASFNNFRNMLDASVRTYVRGSRINFINKVYLGYDTEYYTKSYGEVGLISTQIAGVGALTIRVNNCKSKFDL